MQTEVITLKQLPIIEQTLDAISQQIDYDIEQSKKMVSSNPDKTTSHLKKIRAKLKKDFNLIEEQRKAVKSEIMRPYLEFENLYKEKISDKYKEADKYFKDQIDEIENEVKAEKISKINDYFNDLSISKGIAGIYFEDLNINVNLSGSLKSYYEQVKEKVESISNDFEAINALNLEENEKIELLIEYKKTFDLSATILKLEQKKQEIEKLKGESETKKEEVLEAPEDDEVFTMTFTVKGSKKKLKALKEYLIENELI